MRGKVNARLLIYNPPRPSPERRKCLVRGSPRTRHPGVSCTSVQGVSVRLLDMGRRSGSQPGPADLELRVSRAGAAPPCAGHSRWGRLGEGGRRLRPLPCIALLLAYLHCNPSPLGSTTLPVLRLKSPSLPLCHDPFTCRFSKGPRLTSPLDGLVYTCSVLGLWAISPLNPPPPPLTSNTDLSLCSLSVKATTAREGPTEEC
ncbi:hypothetical protein LZ30DRAFT_207615 [Colletotrichum cereale]|nr:hypothetical protein LZ30DRAFT_207615 [Colletotrichum cereale]